ncbi:MAG: DUF1569 domain-containing protein [Acidobacteriaceae bacterium]
MKNLFDPTTQQEIKSRLQAMQPDSPRQWGTMTPAQALAHCSISLDMSLGDPRPPRKLIGRILGPIIKPLALKDDEPMRRNSPAVDSLIIKDDRPFEPERQRLLASLDRFTTTGPTSCTAHPHAFFGKLTPAQWSILMYKHLDHHLRQFNT